MGREQSLHIAVQPRITDRQSAPASLSRGGSSIRATEKQDYMAFVWSCFTLLIKAWATEEAELDRDGSWRGARDEPHGI